MTSKRPLHSTHIVLNPCKWIALPILFLQVYQEHTHAPEVVSLKAQTVRNWLPERRPLEVIPMSVKTITRDSLCQNFELRLGATVYNKLKGA